MKELVENIEKQITTDKEVISVLPRNGIKAIKTLLKTISDMTEKYENLNEKLLKEIEDRYKRMLYNYNNIKESSNYTNEQKQKYVFELTKQKNLLEYGK